LWFLLACAAETPVEVERLRGPVAEVTEQDLIGALVGGDPSVMEEIQGRRGGLILDFYHPVVEQLVVRAGRGEADWEDLEAALQDCMLLDAEPRRGLAEIDGRPAAELPDVAYSLGATRVVMGRPDHLADPDPLEGRGDLRCRRLRLVPGLTLPQRLPRRLLFAATDGQSHIYISIRTEEGLPEAFTTNSVRDATRLLEAGSWWESAGDGREAELSTIYGTGLGAP
jgi:hypothetical protein